VRGLPTAGSDRTIGPEIRNWETMTTAGVLDPISASDIPGSNLPGSETTGANRLGSERPAPEPGGSKGRPVHLIVGEDDEEDFAILKEILLESHPSFRLTRFPNGQELVDFLLSGVTPPPSALLLDLNMPVKDGRTALHEIKGDDRYRDLPVLIFTSSGMKGDEAYARRFPATGFLTKPMSYHEYVAVVRGLADKVARGEPLGDAGQ
jgi:two-component system, response regulator